MTDERAHHQVRLADGTLFPAEGDEVAKRKWFVELLRALDSLPLRGGTALDLGCREGGYAIALAQRGFDVLGVDCRETNLQRARVLAEAAGVSNVHFFRAVVGEDPLPACDLVLCAGLLYHLDKPVHLLRDLFPLTGRLLYVNTHVAPTLDSHCSPRFKLGALEENEGYTGRWYVEFPTDDSFAQREQHTLSSWNNRRSFWLTKQELRRALSDAGFRCVIEQTEAADAAAHRHAFLALK